MHFTALSTALLALSSMGAASPVWAETSKPTPGHGVQPPAPPKGGPPPPPGGPKPGPTGGHTPPSPPGGPGGPGNGTSPQTGLNVAMKSKGREWFGTALTIRNDTIEQGIISNTLDFGSVTPENAMKWESTEPEQGNFTFADADAVVAFADSNGQEIHCHTLVWHSQLAPWVEAGNFDNATLIEVMKDHIRAVAGRYKGKCTRWDVVNEALNENGTYRESVWYTTIGEAYIPIAFATAHKVDPQAKLFYNDYNLEYGGNKTAGAIRIVNLVRRYGAHIDGVGFQAHLSSEATPTSPGPAPSEAELTATLQSVADLAVDVAYTELDLRMNTPATAEKLQTQADAYSRVVGACLNVARCIGITVWGVVDSYSWIPGVFPGEGAALLWDENYQKKPAYNATLNAILEG